MLEDTIFKDDPRGMNVLYKDDDRMVIWGPASVPVIDKEGDRITTEALEKALPQLLKRSRLSLEHSDQLVGDILESFEAEEEKTVEIDGNTFERSEFPTGVLKKDEDGVPYDGLYVAGEVWNDTQQAKDTQKDIESGDIDSYSISGEAIESSTRVKDGELVDDVKNMDLSAVTLCEEGMNQKAKFAVIKSDDAADGRVTRKMLKSVVRETLSKTMGDKDEETEGGVGEEDAPDNVSDGMSEKELKETFKEAAEDVVKGYLPDADLATKDDISNDTLTREDVEDIVDEKMESDGEEKDLDPETEKAAERLAEQYDKSTEEILELLDSEKADNPFDDDEEEEEEVPEEPPEKPPEEEEEGEVDVPDEGNESPEEPEEAPDEPEMPEEDDKGTHNVDIDTLKTDLPDDLFRAVTEHLSDPGNGEIESKEDGEDEEEDDEETEEKESDDVSKSAGDLDGYLEEVNGASIPIDGEELEKSFEHEDVGELEGESDALNAFYENQEA